MPMGKGTYGSKVGRPKKKKKKGNVVYIIWRKKRGLYANIALPKTENCEKGTSGKS